MTFQELEQWPVMAQCCSMFRGVTGLPFHLLDRQHHCSARFGDEPGQDAFCCRIQCYPLGQRRCRQSGAIAGVDAVRRVDPFVYRCHAGLVDITVPIVSRGSVIGYLCSGKVRDHAADDRELMQLMNAWQSAGYDVADINQLYLQTPILPMDKIQAAARLMQFIVHYVLEMEDKLALLANRLAGNDPVVRAQNYIDLHFADRLRVDEVARLAGLSPSRFNHVFRDRTGMPFSRYLSQLRLDKVKRLLATSRMRITEIAMVCGFGSLANFNRMFKASAGVSPREYRRRHLNTSLNETGATFT